MTSVNDTVTSVNEPGTPVSQVISRLNCLRKMVDDPVFSRQKENIAAAIIMYESGKLPDPQTTWFADGKVRSVRPRASVRR